MFFSASALRCCNILFYTFCTMLWKHSYMKYAIKTNISILRNWSWQWYLSEVFYIGSDSIFHLTKHVAVWTVIINGSNRQFFSNMMSDYSKRWKRRKQLLCKSTFNSNGNFRIHEENASFCSRYRSKVPIIMAVLRFHLVAILPCPPYDRSLQLLSWAHSDLGIYRLMNFLLVGAIVFFLGTLVFFQQCES